VSFTAVAGREYLIQVADFFGDGGTYNLELQGPPAAENTCGSLPPLKEGLQLLSLFGALADGASACDPGTEPDLAYGYTAPTDGTLSVTTCGTDDIHGIDMGEDTLVSLHSACPATAANTIACDDNASPACAADAGVAVDAAVETVLLSGQQIVVRVTRAGPQTSSDPILCTAAFRPGIPYCAGDGTASACPCGNLSAPGRGCAHSQAPGAALSASGDPSVSADSLTLHAASTPPSATGLYLQGTVQVAGGAGAAFGDGLRCVAGTVVRLGFRVSTNGASAFGHADGMSASVSALGFVPAAGGTRHYQLWFRDAVPFCTSATFNLTNGLSIRWRP
jgi:hypothetical protein